MGSNQRVGNSVPARRKCAVVVAMFHAQMTLQTSTVNVAKARRLNCGRRSRFAVLSLPFSDVRVFASFIGCGKGRRFTSNVHNGCQFKSMSGVSFTQPHSPLGDARLI